MTHWLNERIQSFAERPFLSLNEHDYTYAHLSEATQNSKETFSKAGIQAGHVVILKGDYTLNAIAALLALFELKTMVVPVATDAENERQQRIEASNAQWEIHTDFTKDYSIQALHHSAARAKSSAPLRQAGAVGFGSGCLEPRRRAWAQTCGFD